MTSFVQWQYFQNYAPPIEGAEDHGGMTVITSRHTRKLRDAQRQLVLDDCDAAVIQRCADKLRLQQEACHDEDSA